MFYCNEGKIIICGPLRKQEQTYNFRGKFILDDMTEWSASQGNELMTSSQEEVCLIGACRSEQQGGNLLFDVDVERVGAPRRCGDGTVEQERMGLRLRQLRVPEDDLLGEAIAEAFRQGYHDVVRERGYVPADYSMQFAVHHSSGNHVWTRSPNIPLTDWLDNNQRSR